MKRVAALALMLCMVLIAGTALAAEYNLKMQTYYPQTMLDGDKQFVEDVERLSGGRIKITLFSSGELVTSKNILKSVKAGMIDIGHGMGHHYSEIKIGAIESGMPMAWLTPVEAQLMFDEFGLGDIIAKEYEKAGVKYLTPVWAAPYNILSKSPVKSLDDLRKIKMRAVGASAKVLGKLGINTVQMPPEDIYLALSTGQIDAVLYGGAFEYKTMKWYEVAPYYNETALLNPITDSMIISPKLWKKLPADLQGVIELAAKRLRWNYFQWVYGQDFLLRGGIFKGKTTTFGEEDLAKLSEASLAIWDEEAAKSPENAKAVEIIKQMARWQGRLN